MKRLLILVVVLVSGCVQQPVERPAPVASVATPLNVAGQLLIPRLNVSVMRFDSAEDIAASAYDASAQVRSVEQRLLPYRLKLTLEQSGYWGAVRLSPVDDLNSELQIRGSILQSDGTVLRLHITAVDVTGRTWIDQVYEDAATREDYLTDPTIVVDPFQDLYNRFANDLAEVLLVQSLDDIDRLLTVAILRYAALLAPDSFNRFLSLQDGVYQVAALPAENDPLLERMLRIRESEALFADSIDEHYASLFRRVALTYAWWRYYGFELIRGNERLENIDPTRGASKGSWYAVERTYKTYRESRMNEDALRELTLSFDRETEPTLAEVRGRVVRLTGTLEEQYDQWRELLAALYREEIGGLQAD